MEKSSDRFIKNISIDLNNRYFERDLKERTVLAQQSYSRFSPVNRLN